MGSASSTQVQRPDSETISTEMLDIRDFEIRGRFLVLTVVAFISCVMCHWAIPKFVKERGAFERSETHSTPYHMPETLLKIVLFGSNML